MFALTEPGKLDVSRAVSFGPSFGATMLNALLACCHSNGVFARRPFSFYPPPPTSPISAPSTFRSFLVVSLMVWLFWPLAARTPCLLANPDTTTAVYGLPFPRARFTHTRFFSSFPAVAILPASFLLRVPFVRFQPSVTLLKLNTAVGQDLAASLSLSLVDLLADRRAALDRVIIAAAVQPPKRHQVRRPA